MVTVRRPTTTESRERGPNHQGMGTRKRQSPERGRTETNLESGMSPGSGESAELWRALEAGLRDVLPGMEVLDRRLVLDDGGRADLALVDATGRLTLVLLADDVDRTALEVLDTLSFVRRHASLFAHHYRHKVASELAARLFVIHPSGDERLTLRLAPLLEQGIELFTVRTLSSQSGERAYLVPLAPAHGAAEQPAAEGEDAFFAQLSPELSVLANQVLYRVGRLDDELEMRATSEALLWRFRGEVLVRVERGPQGLSASVSPHRERRAVTTPEDLEPLLEAALARLVPLFERAGGGASGLSAEAMRPREATAPSWREARSSVPGGLADASDAPRSHSGEDDRPLRAADFLDDEGPLLTPEEIQAFRD